MGDKDGNGKLNLREMGKLMIAMPRMKKEYAEVILKHADHDKDMMLSYEELINMLSYVDPKEKAKAMFRMYDTDEDCTLSKKELTKLMSIGEGHIGPGMMNLVFSMADEDGDGRISYSEFCNFIEKKEGKDSRKESKAFIHEKEEVEDKDEDEKEKEDHKQLPKTGEKDDSHHEEDKGKESDEEDKSSTSSSSSSSHDEKKKKSKSPEPAETVGKPAAQEVIKSESAHLTESKKDTKKHDQDEREKLDKD